MEIDICSVNSCLSNSVATTDCHTNSRIYISQFTLLPVASLAFSKLIKCPEVHTDVGCYTFSAIPLLQSLVFSALSCFLCSCTLTNRLSVHSHPQVSTLCLVPNILELSSADVAWIGDYESGCWLSLPIIM